MTNKINRGSSEFLYVLVKLRCQRCGDKIGNAWRDAGQHPLAGRDHVERDAGELVDRPDGGWTLRSACRRCGAEPQTRWEVISAVLDTLRHDGTQQATLDV